MNGTIEQAINYVLEREDKSEEQKTDYIAFTDMQLDKQISEIDEQVEYLKGIKEKLKGSKSDLRAVTAQALLNNGIDRLNGFHVSSITLQAASDTKKQRVVIDDEEACINAGYIVSKIDTTRLKKELSSGDLLEVEGLAHLEEYYEEKPESIKINKKRTTRLVEMELIEDGVLVEDAELITEDEVTE